MDGGQQLKEGRAWLGTHSTSDCWLAYSTITGVPSYEGIPCNPLPTGLALTAGQPESIVPTHIQGTVLVSAVDASGVLWGPGSLNPYRQFQYGKPVDMIGNSMLVYQGDFNVPLVAAETHLSQIPLLLRMHREDAALAEAENAAALDPQSPAVQAAFGGTLLRLHRMPEAEHAFALARQEANKQSTEEAKAIEARIARMQHPEL